MYDPDRAVQLLRGNRNGNQAALGDVGFHHAGGNDADTRAVRHSFLNHLQIVEVQGDVHVYLVVAQEAVDFAADGKVFIEADEIDAGQIVQSDFRLLG